MQAIVKADKDDLRSSAKVAHLKDDFYRDGFRVVLLSLAMIVVAIGLLIILSLYFFLHQVLPINFPVYEDWRVQADVPLDRPYLHTADLLQWVSTAVPGVFAVDFLNYDQGIKNASRYFTPAGWPEYMAVTNTFMGHDEVLKKKDFVTASATGAPFVVNQAVEDGKYKWVVQMPIDVRYSGIEGGNQTTSLDVHVTVVRVSTLNNLDGIGIDSITVTRPKI